MLGGAVAGLVVVLAVVGGLELIDRTSFALIALAARARAGPTWAGGATAFVATTGLAVTAGAALAAALGPGRLDWVRIGGGAFLVVYAIATYLRDVDEEVADEARTFASAFLVAFATIFLLELGDTTMIFEIVFVADYGWAVVLVAGAAALVTVAAWDVLLGRRLGARLSPRRLRTVVAVVMVAVGVATIAYGLAPGRFAFV